MLLKVLMILPVSGLVLIMGCGPAAPAPPPLAQPVILEQTLQTYFLNDNEMVVRIKNQGADGLVRINVYTLIDKGEYTRGESGVEKTFRETFTRDQEPPPIYEPKYDRRDFGKTEVHMKAGETKTVKVTLPAYNWVERTFGDSLFVDAKGIPPQPAKKPDAGQR